MRSCTTTLDNPAPHALSPVLGQRERHGEAGPRTTMKTLAERFWGRVRKSPEPDSCWEWLGSINFYGYGTMSISKTKSLMAHRVSWEVARGPIPEGLLVCHHCDNPPCVNPDHLFLGTHHDNTQDAKRKGRLRYVPLRGEDHGNHRLSESQVLEIVALRGSGVPGVVVAELFGVRTSCVSNILMGWTWSSVTGIKSRVVS